MQSETVWYQANKHNVPRLAFINKLDRMGADFFDCIEQMKEKLGVIPAICTIPAGQSSEFEGVIDLIDMKFILKDKNDKTHVKYDLVEIPAKYKALAEEYHGHLLEAASHADDELLELVLEGKEVPKDLLRKALRVGTLSGKLTPIHCGSSKNFHGVQLLLDAVVDYLPSPAERPPVTGLVPKSKDKEKAERKPLATEPFSALAFKTITETTGDLVFLRIYSGELHPRDDVMNTASSKSERISHIYRHDGRAPRQPGSGGPWRDRRRRRPEADLHRPHALRRGCSRSRWKRSASPSR